MCHCRVEIVNFLVHLLVQILNHMWVTSSKPHNLAIRLSNEQNTYDICIFNNYSMSVCWLWDGRIISYPTSASGVIVLLKAPTKYREFFPALFIKQLIFSLFLILSRLIQLPYLESNIYMYFDQIFTCILIIFTCILRNIILNYYLEHGIMAHIPWWLSQSEL